MLWANYHLIDISNKDETKKDTSFLIMKVAKNHGFLHSTIW
jgi:hypothetical protein